MSNPSEVTVQTKDLMTITAISEGLTELGIDVDATVEALIEIGVNDD